MPSSSVTVPREAWDDLLSNWEDDLQARFDEMKECWGGDEHVALWPKLLARMMADAAVQTIIMSHFACIIPVERGWRQ